MVYNDLKSKLNKYNWDNGFEIPNEILADSSCDLALALEVFYLADGYGYLEKSTDTTFEIPLNKAQRYKLRKKGVPEIFLTDL